MTSINTRILSLITQHSIQRADRAIQQALERLTTGKRINRASDDPAGSVAVDLFHARQVTLTKKIDVLQLDTRRLAAREGAQSVIDDLVIELNGLIVQAANRGANSEADRESLQIESDSIIRAINHVAATAVFDGQQLFPGVSAGSYGSLTDTVDDGEGGTKSVTYTLADLRTGGALNLLDGDLESAQRVTKLAVGQVAADRAATGVGIQNKQRDVRLLQTELINITGAASQIEDADFAQEVTNLIRGKLLMQTSIAAALISRRNSAGALNLLGATRGL